eukprot:GDKI01032948.1.p2 GENE.GDKI01032948.1~~GDKI01032948.1.p2  ORF type:complete len:164 (+),score=43.94 GDKI01032948.1:6-497(+)
MGEAKRRTMVIKTENCSYTENKIYPGKVIRLIAKDGRITIFTSSKVKSLIQQRIKAVKLRWTQAWRRHNKKGKTEDVSRRKTRKTQKVQRAVVGLTLDDLKAKSSVHHKKETRSVVADAAAAKAKASKDARKERVAHQSATTQKATKNVVNNKPATMSKAGRR